MSRSKPMRRNDGKIFWKPGTMLAPVPVVLVTCQEPDKAPNIITVAWAGTVCTEPPVIAIALRPERHSYGIIRERGEFVVNLPTVQLVDKTDWCGVVSGRTVDKFARTGLTPLPSRTVRSPGIVECPVNIECKVRQQIALGSHVLFLAEVMGVQVTSSLVTKSGKLALDRAGLIAFAHGAYYSLGKYLGHFGFSVRKQGKARNY